MYGTRIRIQYGLVLLGFVIVFGRLFMLQVVRGPYYRGRAENIRMRAEPVRAPRGRIFDRNGELLAMDEPTLDVSLIMEELDPKGTMLKEARKRFYTFPRKDRKYKKLRSLSVLDARYIPGQRPCLWIRTEGRVIQALPESRKLSALERLVDMLKYTQRERLARLKKRQYTEVRKAAIPVPPEAQAAVTQLATALGIPREELADKLAAALIRMVRGLERRDKPCRLLKGVPTDVMAELEIYHERYPGFIVTARPNRRYPCGDLAAHLLGYLGPLRADEAAKYRDEYDGSRARRYFPEDLIGRAGIERRYNRLLRGARGLQLIERDRHNRRQRVVRSIPALRGHDLYLTLDRRVQQAAETALGECTGAAVVLDATNGELLALATSPRYDLNTFRKEYGTLLSNPERPLVNRASQGYYPAGSVFKLVTATAAMEERQITAHSTFWCGGRYRVGNVMFRCWNLAGHGEIDLLRAIEQSCNVYFFEAVRQLGHDRLIAWARRFGFGQAASLDVLDEAKSPGLLPSPQWVRAHRRRSWSIGDALNLCIGQGDLVATPLQTARMVAAVATGGILPKPHLLREARDADGKPVTVAELEGAKTGIPLDLSIRTLDALHRGMWRVVHAPRGTAYAAWSGWTKDYHAASKTGTAQKPGGNIGWVAMFAPYRCPRICVVVAVEHLTEQDTGGGVAGPIVRQLVETMPQEYFTQEAEKQEPVRTTKSVGRPPSAAETTGRRGT